MLTIDTPDTVDVWHRAVQDALHEGQGVWIIAVVTSANFDRLQRRALAGDRDAVRALRGLTELLERLEVHAEPTSAAPACLTCGDAFWRGHYPAAGIVLCAARDEPSNIMISGVCRRCWIAYATDASRQDGILDGLCRHYGLGDLRILQPLVAAVGYA